MGRNFQGRESRDECAAGGGGCEKGGMDPAPQLRDTPAGSGHAGRTGA